jgi:hypothetical protein
MPSRSSLLEILGNLFTEGPIFFVAVALVAGVAVSSVARAYTDDPSAPPSASAARKPQPALPQGATRVEAAPEERAEPPATATAAPQRARPPRAGGRHTYRPPR